MEYNQEQIIRQVNCICEHTWHEKKHSSGNVINSEALLKTVKEKMFKTNDPHIKFFVDNWIAEFSTRTGSYKVFNKEKGIVGAGGRVAESLGHVSYL